MDWVTGLVIIAGIVAIAATLDMYAKLPKKQSPQIEALQAHVKWLEDHVERHSSNRTYAEERFETLAKAWSEFLQEQSK